ncbi:unnamed protein product [Ceratitis capitata]|uniref:(Mediterranean fruit fly) hypothetical protein n=1 Tax=Ceratitis capitata TaxID=7213 RepID=A0A811U719_CERCA|nr:unnamed protein product [Ceratitis capitata]
MSNFRAKPILSVADCNQRLSRFGHQQILRLYSLVFNWNCAKFRNNLVVDEDGSIALQRKDDGITNGLEYESPDYTPKLANLEITQWTEKKISITAAFNSRKNNQQQKDFCYGYCTCKWRTFSRMYKHFQPSALLSTFDQIRKRENLKRISASYRGNYAMDIWTLIGILILATVTNSSS